MAQRHNRRRIRPRTKSQRNAQFMTAPPVEPRPALAGVGPVPFLASVASPPYAPLAQTQSQLWQHRYTAWQQQYQQQQATAKFQENQRRLFGGEPGDDESLCFRMLEYFGRLDYIDC